MPDPVRLVAEITLGSIFVTASLSKMRDMRGFVLAVLDYDVLPRRLATIYAYALPPAELVCGLALLLGPWPLPTGLLSAAILATFLVGVWVNVARRRALDCHCFGVEGGEPLGWFTLARLTMLLGLAVVISLPGGREAGATDTIPALLLSFGLVLGLRLLGAGPAVASALQMKGNPAPMRHGTRVSLHGMPLLPISVLSRDRTREQSSCGACP